ncbi:MAG TPA: TolC family protein [Bacteroidales bacterium]|nr:TolC family protein [Bacteroidales bacterium]
MVLVTSSEAQQVFRSLDEVQQFAALHNAEVLNAARKTTVAGNELTSAKGALLPKINGTASFQDNLKLSTTLIPAEIFGGPAGTYTEVQFGQKYNYNAFLTGTLEIVNLGTWFQIRNKKIEEQLVQASELQVKQLVNEQIAAAYYMTLISAEACRLAFLNKQTSDSLLQSVTDKRLHGLVDEITLNNLKINNRMLGDNLADNKVIYNQNLGNLKILTGISPNDSVVLEERFSFSGDVFSPAINDLVALPELEVAKYQLKQAQVNLKGSRAAFVPTLSATANWGYQQFNQEFAPSFTDPSWKEVQYVGLRLDFPLFTGLSRSAALKNARLNVQMMQSNYAYHESKVMQENKDLIAAFYANRDKVHHADEICDLYASSYSLSRQRFEAGIDNADKYLQAFIDYLSGQARYLTALSDYYISKAQIQNRINSK